MCPQLDGDSQVVGQWLEPRGCLSFMEGSGAKGRACRSLSFGLGPYLPGAEGILLSG